MASSPDSGALYQWGQLLPESEIQPALDAEATITAAGPPPNVMAQAVFHVSGTLHVCQRGNCHNTPRFTGQGMDSYWSRVAMLVKLVHLAQISELRRQVRGPKVVVFEIRPELTPEGLA